MIIFFDEVDTVLLFSETYFNGSTRDALEQDL